MILARTLFCLLLLALLPACGGDNDTDEAPVAQPADRPVDSDAFGKRSPQSTIDRTKVKTDLISMRAQIRLMHGSNSAYPSKEELEFLQTQYKIGVEYEYDQKAGEVRSKTFPKL